MKKSENMMSTHELLLSLEKVLVSSNVLIRSVKNCENELKNFYLISVEINNQLIELYVNIRNIGSAYLPNKPYILRRQVGKLSFDDLPPNNKKSLSMLIGIANIDNEILLACWNPFYFIGHSTNRSCYVLENSLDKAKNIGLYVGEDCKTPVLVCSSSHFNEMLNVYIERNLVD